MFERGPEDRRDLRDNTYPGAACDVPSHAYSLSFEPYPGWTRKFSPSEEIQAYLLRLVEKWGLRSHLRLGTEIVEARFDEARGAWALTTGAGETVTARVVVSAVAGSWTRRCPTSRHRELRRRDLPHRALAPRLRADPANAWRSSARARARCRWCPRSLRRFEKLSVFQRTPAWVVPKLDKRYSERTLAAVRALPAAAAREPLPEVRHQRDPGPMIFLDAPRLSALGRAHVAPAPARAGEGPGAAREAHAALPVRCKRILVSDDYWASFERENVELVTESIDRIDREGIVTKDGARRDVDAIVTSRTGLSARRARAARGAVPGDGRGGRLLDDAWQAARSPTRA